MILLLHACGAETSVPVANEPSISPPRLLRRISLDLRGVLPSTSELDAVDADPAAIDGYIADYLADTRLEDRMTSLLAERWLTVMDDYEVDYSDYFLPPDKADAFVHSVGGEPLRLLAHIIKNDLPWTDAVTADYTMANELLRDIWPVEYPEGGSGWQVSRYTDGRPAAGVLATNGLWWRYVTNDSNKNRARVAAISRLLLCTDILSRPVVFSRSTSTDSEDAIRNEPTCLGCHSAIDPIAASLFGFWWTIGYNRYEMQTYHPEREPLGMELLGTDPAWYGQPMAGLVELGWNVANDPRYARCGAQSFAEQLWRRETTLDDWDRIEELRSGFVENGLRPQALITAILHTPEYQDGERLLSPNQVGTLVEELTGFEWIWQGYAQLENDTHGYRVLQGGVDGYSVTQPQKLPGMTWGLVMKRVAQFGGASAVANGLVAVDARPGDTAFSAEIEQLHWRLYAERADAGWISGISDLWSAIEAQEGSDSAWAGAIEAMLRDPKLVSY